MGDKKYIVGADIIRVISGFGVVLIHVTDPFLTSSQYIGVGGFAWLIINIMNTAFRMSVPLFIMLSGYLLLDLTKEMSFRTFYKKRFVRVAIPFVFWISFYFFWQHFFLNNTMDGMKVLTKLLFINMDHLYFLFIIVELYFVTPLFYTFLKNTQKTSHTVLFISSCAFTLLLYFINNMFPKNSVLTQESILTIFIPFISYYVAGFYLKKFKIFAKYSYYSFLFFIAVLLFTAIISEGRVNTFFRSYGSFNVMLMAFITFMAVIHADYKNKILQNPYFLKILKTVASTIFGIYLVHMVVIDLVDYYFYLSPINIIGPRLDIVIFKIFLVFFICFVVVFIGRKIPYVRSIFG